MRYDLVTNHWWTGMIKIYIKKATQINWSDIACNLYKAKRILRKFCNDQTKTQSL